jgi:2-oxoglutarate dehydrogenase E1 component
LRELVAALRETYCATLGVEFSEIPDRRKREWLARRMESSRNRMALDAEARLQILRDLLVADRF